VAHERQQVIQRLARRGRRRRLDSICWIIAGPFWFNAIDKPINRPRPRVLPSPSLPPALVQVLTAWYPPAPSPSVFREAFGGPALQIPLGAVGWTFPPARSAVSFAAQASAPSPVCVRHVSASSAIAHSRKRTVGSLSTRSPSLRRLARRGRFTLVPGFSAAFHAPVHRG